MFKAFVNPAAGRYAWVGLDKCKVAYLKDSWCSTKIIAWSYFLLLLDVQAVHLPRPKNQYETDMCIQPQNTILFFANSKEPKEFIGKDNICDEREYSMMSSR